MCGFSPQHCPDAGEQHSPEDLLVRRQNQALMRGVGGWPDGSWYLLAANNTGIHHGKSIATQEREQQWEWVWASSAATTEECAALSAALAHCKKSQNI